MSEKDSLLLQGLAASPGVVVAPVAVLRTGFETTPESGFVAVCQSPAASLLPVLLRAAAIVTDEGGLLCHAAVVARELGIPCIVGTRTATTVLTAGQWVVVDGLAGTVHAHSAC